MREREVKAESRGHETGRTHIDKPTFMIELPRLFTLHPFIHLPGTRGHKLALELDRARPIRHPDRLDPAIWEVDAG